MKRYLLRSFGLLGLSLSLLTGCPSEEVTPEPSEPPATDTPTVTPSPTPFEEVGVITPTPTPTPVPNPVETVQIVPEQFKLDVASNLTYSLKAARRNGDEVDQDTLNEVVWESSDTAVATIDASGRATPVAPGLTLITASLQGAVSNSAQLEVLPNGQIFVQVIDADTKLPVVGATVYRGTDGLELATTDEEGKALLEGDFSGPQTVTSVHPDYHNVTLGQALQKSLTLPMRSKASTTLGKFSGDVDFSAMGPLPDSRHIRVGLITRSFYGTPLALDTNTIIGAYRYVNVCGAETAIPSNIVGQVPETCPEDPNLELYSVPGPTGTYDTYMLAGDLVANDVLSWLTDPEIFTNLGKLLDTIPNMNEFSYDTGAIVSIAAPNNTPDIPLAPAGRTNSNLTVKIPKLPSGIDPSYLPVAFVIADMGEHGFMPVGLEGAKESSTVAVWHAPEFDAVPKYGLVMAGESGVGAAGAYVAVMAQPKPGTTTAVPPDFMQLLQPDKIQSDPGTRTFYYYPVADTSVYRTIFTWRQKINKKWTDSLIWDVYLPEDVTSFTLPELPGSLPFVGFDGLNGIEGYINWELWSYDNLDETFNTYTSDPEGSIHDASIELYRTSRNVIYDLLETQ